MSTKLSTRLRPCPSSQRHSALSLLCDDRSRARNEGLRDEWANRGLEEINGRTSHMGGTLLVGGPSSEETERGRVLLERVPVLRELLLLDRVGIRSLSGKRMSGCRDVYHELRTVKICLICSTLSSLAMMYAIPATRSFPSVAALFETLYARMSMGSSAGGFASSSSTFGIKA